MQFQNEKGERKIQTNKTKEKYKLRNKQAKEQTRGPNLSRGPKTALKTTNKKETELLNSVVADVALISKY